MSRRDRLRNPFGEQEEPLTRPTPAEAANTLFGSDNLPDDSSRALVKPFPLNEIVPDPAQPRRTIPSEIRQLAANEMNNISTLLVIWYSKVQEANSSFDLDAYLLGNKEIEDVEIGEESSEGKNQPPSPVNPIEAAFLKVIALAASIRRDGLLNPISIVPVRPKQYQLETGERRWLAYHLLYLYFDGTHDRPDERKRWEKISARLMSEKSVWRQASENTARQDLNAIGRARQFAVLLMDLYGMDKFQPFHAFDNEHGFYAQVADGDVWRIPRGTGEKLLSATGLKSIRQAGYYRQLLGLPYEVWQLADDYNLTENALRDARIASGGDPDTLIANIYEAAQNLTDFDGTDDTGTTVLVSPSETSENIANNPSRKRKPPTPPTKKGVVQKFEQVFWSQKRKLTPLIKKVNKVGEGDRERLSQIIEEQEQWLADLKRSLFS